MITLFSVQWRTTKRQPFQPSPPKQNVLGFGLSKVVSSIEEVVRPAHAVRDGERDVTEARTRDAIIIVMGIDSAEGMIRQIDVAVIHHAKTLPTAKCASQLVSTKRQ